MVAPAATCLPCRAVCLVGSCAERVGGLRRAGGDEKVAGMADAVDRDNAEPAPLASGDDARDVTVAQVDGRRQVDACALEVGRDTERAVVGRDENGSRPRL